MSDRPTPETDAAWACFKGYMEPLQDVKDLSRKLERERDEAREAFVIATDQMVIAQGKVREANKERDEARGVLKRIAHASMNARHKEEDYAEWEKAVESLQGICEEKNFINE